MIIRFLWATTSLILVTSVAQAQMTDILNPTSQKVEAIDRIFKPEPRVVHRIDDLNAVSPFVKVADLNAIDDDTLVIWDTRYYYRWSLDDPANAFRIGAGFGGGPGEYRSPMNAFLRGGRLINVDDEAFRIQLWDLQTGKFLRALKLPRQVQGYRIVVDPSGLTAYVLSFQWAEAGQIIRLDLSNGETKEHYMQLPDRKEFKAGYCHDGRLAIDEVGNVYHASNNAGNLTKFKPGAKGHVYNRSVISEHKNDCQVEIEKSGRTEITNRSKTYKPITLDIEYSDGKLYLLHSGRGAFSNNIVDVYDAANGDYLYTLKLTYAAREIAVVGKSIYAYGFSSAQGNNTFTKYVMQ